MIVTVLSFIKQLDSVLKLATEDQILPLLLFVKTKITGRAKNQININWNLTTLEEISQMLINLYQDRQTLDQLLEELNNSKQGLNQDITLYYEMIEDNT